MKRDTDWKRRGLIFWALAAVLLASASCSDDRAPDDAANVRNVSNDGIDANDDTEPDPFTSQIYLIDENVRPVMGEVPGIDGGPERPVVAIASTFQTDFVEHEIFVQTPHAAELEAVLERWNATLLFSVAGGEHGDLHLLKIDPESVDPAAIHDQLGEDELEGLREHRVSSLSAVLTIVAAAIETNEHGNRAAINYVSYSDDFSRRVSIEAPDGPAGYDPNAFSWPYMRRGAEQDVGVAEAWRLLDEAGRLENRTTVIVADGGFRQHDDVPVDIEIHPAGAWDIENPARCTDETDCKWHGTKVSEIAFGTADNGFGVAGSGAPVAQGILLQAPSPDFASVVRYLRIAAELAAEHGDRTVVNISGGSPIVAGVCLTGACAALDTATTLLRSIGLLLVASAGNEGTDVDRTDCTLWGAVCWEEELWAPCELEGVICVGGLAWDSTGWDIDSNWSGDHDDCCTVDLWSSFEYYNAPDPADGNETVQRVAGTSYSAPFVAGIAALVWSAAPGFDDDQVERTLFQTAHQRPSRRTLYHVNAYQAVRSALGGDAPPFVRIVRPEDGAATSGSAAVSLEAEVDDDGDDWTISWQSSLDGPIGAASTFTSVRSLSPGLHTITATVSDGTWEVDDSVQVEVANEVPNVEILVPEHFATFYESEPIILQGRSFDPDVGGPLPDGGMTWWIDDEFIGRTATQRVEGGTLDLGIHEIRFQGEDGTHRTSTSINIFIEEDPAVVPPTAIITSPASGTSFFADTHDSASDRWYANVTLCGHGEKGTDEYHGPQHVTWYMRPKSGGVWQIAAAGTSEGLCPNVRFYRDGTGTSWYEVKLRVEDELGEVGTMQIDVGAYGLD